MLNTQTLDATRPHGATTPMPREATTIPTSAMRIAEISDNINIKTNPIVIRCFPDYQTEFLKASQNGNNPILFQKSVDNNHVLC